MPTPCSMYRAVSPAAAYSLLLNLIPAFDKSDAGWPFLCRHEIHSFGRTVRTVEQARISSPLAVTADGGRQQINQKEESFFMPSEPLTEFSITDTGAYMGLAVSQGWWVCATCGAHFPTSVPPLADKGVTQCSSCVNVKILSAIIPAHLKCLSKALELMRGFEQVTFHCTFDCPHNSYVDTDTSELLRAVTAFLEETSLLLMHWEKDIPHA